MRRGAIPITETLGGRVVLALAAMAAIMAIQAIVDASPALAITERPAATDMTNGEVYATALSDDGKTLYIGGKFTKVKTPSGTGRTVSNLAAINVQTGDMIRTWRPQLGSTGDGAVVRSLIVKNGLVYIGGNFTAVEGQARTNLAAVGANTGSVMLSTFAPQVGKADSIVYALEADGSKLYAGGGFSNVNGQQRKNLVAFSLATGELDPAWKPGTGVADSCTSSKCSPKVRSLELGPQGTSIFVGGPFSYITGSDGVGDARQSVARVYTDTGNLHPWKIPDGTIAPPQTAWDLIYANGKLYGGFGATANYVAAFNTDPGSGGAQAWRFRTRGNVQALALTSDRLFFGGHFGLNNLDQKVCNGTKFLRGLSSLNPDTGRIYCGKLGTQAQYFVPSLDQAKRPSYEGAWTMATTGSYLWVGGGFIGVSDSINQQPVPGTGVTEVPQTNLARFTL